MRLCTIMNGGKAVVGVKNGDGKIIDLSKQMPRGPKSVVEILAGGKKVQAEVAKACAKPKAGATVSAKSAKYLPPIPNPGKILCIGLNYRKHAEETGNPIPPYPVVFCRFNNTLVPHNGKMPMPSHSSQLDWEAELTIVIGKKCRNVPKEKALSVIAGYACFNDGSVRDWQRKSGQFTLGKNFDGTGGFGPDIVTSDELPRAAAHHDPRQRRGHAGQQHRRPDLRRADPGARALQGHDPRSGRHHLHRHAVGRGDGAHPAALAEAGRRLRGRDRENRRAAQSDRAGGLGTHVGFLSLKSLPRVTGEEDEESGTCVLASVSSAAARGPDRPSSSV